MVGGLAQGNRVSRRSSCRRGLLPHRLGPGESGDTPQIPKDARLPCARKATIQVVRRISVMAQWEYRHERIERPLGSEGRDVTPEALRDLNQLGADGWEVCSVVVYQQSWIVLLK